MHNRNCSSISDEGKRTSLSMSLQAVPGIKTKNKKTRGPLTEVGQRLWKNSFPFWDSSFITTFQAKILSPRPLTAPRALDLSPEHLFPSCSLTCSKLRRKSAHGCAPPATVPILQMQKTEAQIQPPCELMAKARFELEKFQTQSSIVQPPGCASSELHFNWHPAATFTPWLRSQPEPYLEGIKTYLSISEQWREVEK